MLVQVIEYALLLVSTPVSNVPVIPVSLVSVEEQEVVLVDVQVITDDLPDAICEGLALTVTVGTLTTLVFLSPVVVKFKVEP